MSKHRPPPPTSASAGSSSSRITPASTFMEIYRAKVAVQGEITRRAAYEELLALEAKLAKLPPLPAPPPATANDDS